MPKLTSFERKGRDAGQFGDPKRQRFSKAMKLSPRCNDRVDRCERVKGLATV